MQDYLGWCRRLLRIQMSKNSVRSSCALYFLRGDRSSLLSENRSSHSSMESLGRLVGKSSFTTLLSTRQQGCKDARYAMAMSANANVNVNVIYFVEVTSSWCYWAEPAWREIKSRFADQPVTFDWKIALLDQSGLPSSREQIDWFYRRSGTIMRSPFMLNS